MKPTSKTTIASAATLFASAFLVMTAPAARADEYCNYSPQANAGCGFTSMEQCQAATSGVGGVCSAAPSLKTPNDALAYQAKRPHARRELHPRKEPAGH
jgi:hypothetical protein